MLTTPTTSTNGVQPASVRLPGKPVDPDGADLAAPIAGLLRELGVLETEEDAEKGVSVTGTPQSLQGHHGRRAGGDEGVDGGHWSERIRDIGRCLVHRLSRRQRGAEDRPPRRGRRGARGDHRGDRRHRQGRLRAYAPIIAPASGAAPAGAAAASNGGVPVTPALLAALSSQPTAVQTGGPRWSS